MSLLKRLWAKIAWFTEAFEVVDDPTGDFILSLGKRVDKLERDVELIEKQQHSSAGCGGMQQEPNR